MRIYHRLMALVIAVLISASTASAATFKVDAQYFWLDGTDDSGCVLFYISAYRSGGTTYLLYDSRDICLDVPVAQGFGTIPNTALVFTPTSATLTLDVIQLSLERNGRSSYWHSGQDRLEFDNIKLSSRGTRSEQSATVTGQAFGYTLSGDIGQLGTTRELYLEVVKP